LPALLRPQRPPRQLPMASSGDVYEGTHSTPRPRGGHCASAPGDAYGVLFFQCVWMLRSPTRQLPLR
jgi:hypothetical protein